MVLAKPWFGRYALHRVRTMALSFYQICSTVKTAFVLAHSRYKKLEDLLEKSFPLVKMPSIQPVVMCVMKHLPKVGNAMAAISSLLLLYFTQCCLCSAQAHLSVSSIEF